MAFGRPAFGLETTLRIHAIAAPVFAAVVSLVYFTRFRAVTPLVAAAFFTAFIVVLDAAVVAPVFEKSYVMFGSILGTWLPFLSVFVATYLTGTWIVVHSGEFRAADSISADPARVSLSSDFGLDGHSCALTSIA